jgi:hypothetical protein
LAAGVLCVGASGSVPGIAPRVLLIAAAVPLVGVTFWLDRRAPDNLFPRRALSINAPIGLAALLMFRFVHITLGKPQTVSAHEECRE